MSRALGGRWRADKSCRDVGLSRATRPAPVAPLPSADGLRSALETAPLALRLMVRRQLACSGLTAAAAAREGHYGKDSQRRRPGSHRDLTWNAAGAALEAWSRELTWRPETAI